MKLVHRAHPALRAAAAEVPFKTDVSWLIIVMWAEMTQGRGCGLAANQLGELDRVIVVHVDNFKQEIINPVITKRYGGKTTSREGCLSFPGITAPMIRDRQIIVEGFDRYWKPIKRKLKGRAAICVQHEVDHLDGVTIEGFPYD